MVLEFCKDDMGGVAKMKEGGSAVMVVESKAAESLSIDGTIADDPGCMAFRTLLRVSRIQDFKNLARRYIVLVIADESQRNRFLFANP